MPATAITVGVRLNRIFGIDSKRTLRLKMERAETDVSVAVSVQVSELYRPLENIQAPGIYGRALSGFPSTLFNVVREHQGCASDFIWFGIKEQIPCAQLVPHCQWFIRFQSYGVHKWIPFPRFPMDSDWRSHWLPVSLCAVMGRQYLDAFGLAVRLHGQPQSPNDPNQKATHQVRFNRKHAQEPNMATPPRTF